MRAIEAARAGIAPRLAGAAGTRLVFRNLGEADGTLPRRTSSVLSPLPQRESDDAQEDHGDHALHPGIVSDGEKDSAECEARDHRRDEADGRRPVSMAAIRDEREHIADDERDQRRPDVGRNLGERQRYWGTLLKVRFVQT